MSGAAAVPQDSEATKEGEKPGYHVFNQPEEIVNTKSSQEFIGRIREALDHGYGFVPFIGAGMSAPSGTPLVTELHHYLHACIAMALGVGEPGKRPWNPRTDHWPPFTIRNQFTRDDWLRQISNEHTRRREQPWSPETLIFQQAVGDLAEWRGALVFLSRIVREIKGIEGEVEYGLALDAPDAEVIDSGIRRAISGRQPTLGHRMLATLATHLRLDIILTTNFDDLLESAFREMRNPLSVFEVHMASSLPPWSALEEKRSLIKMHGNLYSLRVDYTLDALPVESDRWRFLEYLLLPRERLRLAEGLPSGSLTSRRTEPGRQPPVRQPLTSERFEHGNHLLVMGVAASERRTRAFIEHACRHLKKGFQVFWLCYTPRDLVEVKKFAQESALEPETFQILRHPDYGLLFTELYQTIRRGIPTSGIIYPFASRLSMPPMPRVVSPGGSDVPRERSRAGEEYSKAVKERLDRIQDRGYQYHKLIVATSAVQEKGRPVEGGGATASANTGITTACARVFEQIRVEQVAIWLDMNDVWSTDDLFEQLLDAVNYRAGQSSPLPVHVRKHPQVQAEEIIGLVKDANRKWVFFLNARETPGTNLIDERQPDQKELPPNDWLDDLTSEGGRLRSDDESNNCPRFLQFIAALCGPRSPLISVILMCRQRSATRKSVLVEQILAEGLGASLVELTTDCAEVREVKSVIEVLRWAKEQSHGRDDRKQRRKFLQALISLQRTALPRDHLVGSLWGRGPAAGGGRKRQRDPMDRRVGGSRVGPPQARRVRLDPLPHPHDAPPGLIPAGGFPEGAPGCPGHGNRHGRPGTRFPDTHRGVGSRQGGARDSLAVGSLVS